MAKLPVKARSVLKTFEQVKREAGKSVRIAVVGPKNAGKTSLISILSSSAALDSEIFYVLEWGIDKLALHESIRSADCLLVVLDATGNLGDEAQKAKEILAMNTSSLLVLNKVDEVGNIETTLQPTISFFDRFAEKVHFVSALKGINVEDELAQAIFDVVDTKNKGIALASKAPVFRRIATSRVIHHTSAQNGIIGAVTILPGADMPLLTANQLRMVLKIAAIYDEELTFSRMKELLTVIGAGFTLRALARQLLDLVPGVGWVIKGTVAYAGTEALGQAAQKYFEKGYSRLDREKMKKALQSIQGGKTWRKSRKS